MKTYNLFPELRRILEDKRIKKYGVEDHQYEDYLMAEQFALDLRNLSDDDIVALESTYADLEELNLDKLPYEKIVIHVLSEASDPDILGSKKEIIISYFFQEEKNKLADYSIIFDSEETMRRTVEIYKKHDPAKKKLGGIFRTVKLSLIVMLATRNAIKEYHEARKPPNRLTGKSHKRGSGGYTIIRCPEYNEIEGGEGSGTKKRPHLRRGHIRKLHPTEKTKWIWVAPCFVNGEPEVRRTSYLVDADAPA